MDAPLLPDALPESPYRGIEPFRLADRAIFPAREKEVWELLGSVALYRGVLLYGDSGVGKSSLLNAGFIPAAAREGLLPVRLRVQPRPGAEFVVERISVESAAGPPFLPSIFDGRFDGDEATRAVLSAADFVEAVRASVGPGAGSRPLLIFDQFEELVTLFEEASKSEGAADDGAADEARAGLLAAVLSLLRDDSLPIKLLFTFREDYLAKLNALFDEYPDLLDQSQRLLPPRIDSVYDIIRAPFRAEELRRHFGREINEGMARRLAEDFRKRSPGGSANLSELQIACLELWRAPDPEALYAQTGIQGLLENYLSSSIERLAEDALRDAAVALLGHLVTSSGTRNIVAEEELISRASSQDGIEAPVLRRALAALEERTKLVRREYRYGNDFYEISSEFLIPWISQQKSERLKQAERRKLEAEAEESLNRERDRAKRFRRVAILFGMLLALFVAAAVFAFYQWREAREARSLAEAQTRATELQAQKVREAEELAQSGLERLSRVEAELKSAEASTARILSSVKASSSEAQQAREVSKQLSQSRRALSEISDSTSPNAQRANADNSSSGWSYAAGQGNVKLKISVGNRLFAKYKVLLWDSAGRASRSIAQGVNSDGVPDEFVIGAGPELAQRFLTVEVVCASTDGTDGPYSVSYELTGGPSPRTFRSAGNTSQGVVFIRAVFKLTG